MRPRLLSRLAAVSRIANLLRNGLVRTLWMLHCLKLLTKLIAKILNSAMCPFCGQYDRILEQCGGEHGCEKKSCGGNGNFFLTLGLLSNLSLLKDSFSLDTLTLVHSDVLLLFSIYLFFFEFSYYD